MGKNVSILMPPPYNQQHNTYLKSHTTTGNVKILGTRQRLEGRHKKGHNFLISLMVSKVESGGEVSFMGVMQELADDGAATISLTQSGNIRAVNLVFESMFGYASTAIQGGHFRSIITASGAAALPEVLAAARTADVERTFEAKHKNGSFFPISCAFTAEKTGQNGVIVRIIALNDNLGMITIDEHGLIQSANSFISHIFGWRTEELVTMNISQLMPRPYSRFHAAYLSNYRRSGTGKVVGDARGRIVSGLHRDGRVFRMRLEVHEMRDEEQAHLTSLADPAKLASLSFPSLGEESQAVLNSTLRMDLLSVVDDEDAGEEDDDEDGPEEVLDRSAVKSTAERRITRKQKASQGTAAVSPRKLGAR